ncbi:hypothetical protein GIB67_006355 [Kingdonia uniflora]|uniref:Uncharacterized protein n=1 Tax=Kingdonia uniflora TaxID=39325 RepID=A0A7J7P0K3_9MAGN|nr:hypothetical protein GIB67_006355 [Kingdonia uniflora]
MQMSEGGPHPSTLLGFRGTKDLERSVTRSRFGRKKKRVEFEDVQPQNIQNPTEDNFPRMCITQLPDGVSQIYYTGKELTNRDSMRVHDTFTTVFKVWKYIATLPAVSYDGTWSVLSNARQLLPNIDSSHIKSGNVSIAHLRTYLTVEANREDDITIARVFILFVTGHLRYHIDHRTFEVITWEPWFDSAVSETEDVLNAKLISRKRILLQVPNRNCEYYLGDRCWRQVTGEVRIPLDPPLSMSPHITPAALHEMRQAGFVDCEQFVVGEERETYASYWAEQTSEVGHMLTDSQRMGNLDLFRPSALRAGITPLVVASVSVHSLSQDFSLPGEAEGPDLGWHMEWTGRQSARDSQRLQEVAEELTIARRQIDSIDHQLYANDLQLRRERDVRVVPLPPGGDARMRQRRSGPRTRGRQYKPQEEGH